MPLAADVDLAAVAADARCRGFSGADLASLAREAAVGALRACGETETPVVRARDFDRALSVTLPSVSPKDPNLSPNPSPNPAPNPTPKPNPIPKPNQVSPKDEKAYASIGKKLRQSRASQVGSTTAASAATPAGGTDGDAAGVPAADAAGTPLPAVAAP